MLGLTGTPWSEYSFTSKAPTPSTKATGIQFSDLGLAGLSGDDYSFIAKAPDTTGRASITANASVSGNNTVTISERFDVDFNADFTVTAGQAVTTSGFAIGQAFLSGNAVITSGPNVSGRIDATVSIDADPVETNYGIGNATASLEAASDPSFTAIASGSVNVSATIQGLSFQVDYALDPPIDYYVTPNRQAETRQKQSFIGQADTVYIDYRPWSDDHGDVFEVTWEVLSGAVEITDQINQSNVVSAVLTTNQSGSALIKITAKSRVNEDVQYINVVTRDISAMYSDDYGFYD